MKAGAGNKSRFQNIALGAKTRISSRDHREILPRILDQKDVRDISHRARPKAGAAAPNGCLGIGSKGVTLVEICLVGLILSVIFAISWPLMNRLGRRAQLDAAASEITATLRYARDYALNEGKQYCVQFDIPGRRYWLAAGNDQLVGIGGFSPLGDALHKKRTWPEEIKLDAISTQQVIFDPDGTSLDFAVTFRDNRGDTLSLNLNGSTGRIEIIRR